MKQPTNGTRENVVEILEKLFHEPNRLAIVSAVCAAAPSISFTELKDGCNLTDGNLNRHLKVLLDADVIRIEKAFVDQRPRTSIFITKKGLAQFSQYLEALEDVLVKARQSVAPDRKRVSIISGKTAPARA